ncbi:MAG: nucleotidyltransferase family protein [Desulfobacteraceae bacterium]|nr:nucleotidyltransferase family protein [Desulfobacteraceae bacterium]
MKALPGLFSALVLAADRTVPDPVALAAGVGCKALAPVGGTPMVIRVLDALAAARLVGACVLCGPGREIVAAEPLLQARLAAGGLRWLPPLGTPSTSAHAALQTVPAATPVLLTTGDHALLSPAIVDHFCRAALDTGCDLVAGFARHADIMAVYPGMRRTATRFQDGPLCGCNLYAFLTPRSRLAADLWRQVEKDRKSPWKMLQRLGPEVLLRYLLGRLTLADGLHRISRRMGSRVGAVILPFAEAAVDVDTVSDWRFAQGLASKNKG